MKTTTKTAAIVIGAGTLEHEIMKVGTGMGTVAAALAGLWVRPA